MSLETPTTQQINDNIIAQLEAALNQSIPLLPKSFLRVLARALSGVFILLYKYAGFIQLQQFVRHASFKETTINGQRVVPLVEWGRLIGLGAPATPTAAELDVTVTVEGGGGNATLRSGAQLVDAASGITYLVVNSVALETATVTARVRAATAGSSGNQLVGAVLSFANPLANVARDTTVSVVAVTGSDAEGEAAYRQRVIDRFQKRPQGGAYADYEQWAEETPGVINVYPYTSPYPGQVDLYVEATVASSGSVDGIPTSAQLLAVLDSVQRDTNGLASRRPIGALVNAYPIKRVVFTVEVSTLDVDNISDARDQITAAITEYFGTRDPYIVGLSVLPRRDRVTRSALGGVVDDIISARGGVFGGVTLKLDGVAIDLYTLGVGEKAKTSGVTFL